MAVRIEDCVGLPPVPKPPARPRASAAPHTRAPRPPHTPCESLHRVELPANQCTGAPRAIGLLLWQSELAGLPRCETQAPDPASRVRRTTHACAPSSPAHTPCESVHRVELPVNQRVCRGCRKKKRWHRVRAWHGGTHLFPRAARARRVPLERNKQSSPPSTMFGVGGVIAAQMGASLNSAFNDRWAVRVSCVRA